MQVTVRLFARLRDIVGKGELEREFPAGATAQHVWNALATEHPALAPYGAVSSCAVNEEYARFSAPLSDGDEIAFLPPVSGGESRGSGFAIRGSRFVVRRGRWSARLRVATRRLAGPNRAALESREDGTRDSGSGCRMRDSG